jgi:hypothetical protein
VDCGALLSGGAPERRLVPWAVVPHTFCVRLGDLVPVPLRGTTSVVTSESPLSHLQCVGRVNAEVGVRVHRGPRAVGLLPPHTAGRTRTYDQKSTVSPSSRAAGPLCSPYTLRKYRARGVDLASLTFDPPASRGSAIQTDFCRPSGAERDRAVSAAAARSHARHREGTSRGGGP